MATTTRENRLKSRQERQAQMANQRKLGFVFAMPATNLLLDTPVQARVRRISLTDEAAFDLIPRHLQDEINEGIKVIQDLNEQMQKQGDVGDNLKDRVKSNVAVIPAASAYCAATFVSPRLARTDDEADRFEQDEQYWIDNGVDPDEREVWTVDMVDPEDRIDWYLANMDADRAKAMDLKHFRPRSVIDVPSRPAESMGQPTTVDFTPVTTGGI